MFFFFPGEHFFKVKYTKEWGVSPKNESSWKFRAVNGEFSGAAYGLLYW